MLILLIFLFLAYPSADALKDIGIKIANEQKELDKLNQKINEGNNLLKKLQVEAKEITNQVYKDRQSLNNLKNNVEITESELSVVQKQVESTENKISKIKTTIAEYEVKFYSRLRYIYENRNQPYLKILLNAESLSDLDKRFFYYNKIIETDSGFYKELKEQYKNLIFEQKNLSENNLKTDLLSKKLLNQREVLLTRIRQDTLKLQKINEEQEELKARAIELDKTQQFIKDKINNLISTQKQISEDLKNNKQIMPVQPTKQIAKNSLLWPLEKNFQISKKFGNVGVGNATLFSSGLDLESNYDQSVLAAEDGIIFYRGSPAGLNSSYGRVIMIAHGNYDGKFITLYGNLDNIQVALNQTIKKGERIATIASDKGSARLHFQVRVNGVPQDPILWLQKQ